MDYVYVCTNGNATEIPDKVLDVILNQPHASHAKCKEHARNTHRANGTHPRDHAATLKHNLERRGEKLYNQEGRNRKRKNAAKREIQADINLVFVNKRQGFGFVDYPELFYNAGYDAGYDDGYDAGYDNGHAATCKVEAEAPETPMPWENCDLVLYLFDDAAKYICQYEKYAEKYATEIELMRAAFKNGVYKLTHSTTPVVADILFPEDVLYLLLGKEGYAYMQRQSMHLLVENVAYNLYALYEQPEIHQYYLERLKNRDANCE